MSEHGTGIANALQNIFGTSPTTAKGPEITIETPITVKPDGPIDYGPVEKELGKPSRFNKNGIKIPVDIEPHLNDSDIRDIEKIIESLETEITEKKIRTRRNQSGSSYSSWLDNLIKTTKRQQRETFTPGDIAKYIENIKILQSLVDGSVKINSKNVDLGKYNFDFLKKFSIDDINAKIDKEFRSRININKKSSNSIDAKLPNISFDKGELSGEIDALNQVKSAVDNITDAINKKNDAFKNEASVVNKAVSEEISSLSELEHKLNNDIVKSAQNAGDAISKQAQDAGKIIVVSNQNINASNKQTKRSSASNVPKNISNADDPYVFHGEPRLSSRAIADYIANTIDKENGGPKSKYGFRDLSRFTKQIEKFQDDGSLNIEATTLALSEFGTAIDKLPDESSIENWHGNVEKLFDILTQMVSFNEVLNKIGESNAQASGLSSFKIPGVNKIVKLFDHFKDSYSENYIKQQEEIRRQQEEERKRQAEERIKSIVVHKDGEPVTEKTNGLVDTKKDELKVLESINDELDEAEQSTEEELKYAQQLREELQIISDLNFKEELNGQKKVLQDRLKSRMALGLGSLLNDEHVGLLSPEGYLPKEWADAYIKGNIKYKPGGNIIIGDKKDEQDDGINPAWKENHPNDSKSTGDGYNNKNVNEFIAALDTATKQFSSLLDTLQKASDFISSIATNSNGSSFVEFNNSLNNANQQLHSLIYTIQNASKFLSDFGLRSSTSKSPIEQTQLNSSTTDQISQKENAAIQIQKEISAVDEDISATKSLADVKRRIIQKLSEDEKLTNYAKLGSNVAKYEAKYGVKSPFELDPRHADAELADIKDGLLRFVNGFRKQISQIFDGFIGKHMPGLQNTANPTYTNINPSSLATSQFQIDTKKDAENIASLIKKISEVEEKLKSDIPNAVQVKTSSFQQQQKDVEQVVNSERGYFEKFEEYLKGSFSKTVADVFSKLNSDSFKVDIGNLLTSEQQKLPDLTKAIEDVTNAVNKKTDAFKIEHDNVARWIGEEVDALDNLSVKAGGVAPNLAPENHNNQQTNQSNRNNTGRTNEQNDGVRDNRIYPRDDMPTPPERSVGASLQLATTPDTPRLLSSINTLIDTLTTGRGKLKQILSQSEDILAGKFNYEQIKKFRLDAQPIRDVIEQLNTENSELRRAIDASRVNSKDNQIYKAFLAFREEYNRVVQVLHDTALRSGQIGDVTGIWGQEDIPLAQRARFILNSAFEDYPGYHEAFSRTNTESYIKKQIAYLNSHAEKHIVDNELSARGLLSDKANGQLDIDNANWLRKIEIIRSYFENASFVSDEIRKSYDELLDNMDFAREHIAPIKIQSSGRNVSEAEKKVLDAIVNQLKMSDDYLQKSALEREDLLNPTKADNFSKSKLAWKEYQAIIDEYLDQVKKAGQEIPEQVQKAIAELKQHIAGIEQDVIPEAVALAEARARDPKAQAITGKSKKAKVYEAYRKLSDPKSEYEYQRGLLFRENGLLNNDQLAKLGSLEAEHKKNEEIIQDYKTEDAYIQSLASGMESVVSEAKKLAGQALSEKIGKPVGDDELSGMQQILDMQYRMINLRNKRDTVGVTNLELNALNEATKQYNELYNSLNQIEDKSEAVKRALDKINNKESEVSNKLSRKWSDIRDRRYGSYLNDDDQSSYRSRRDIEAGLQRYVSRQGAKSFELFDGKSIGNIQKYRAEILDFDGTIEKLNLTLNKTTGELYSISAGTKQATTFFESFGAGLKRRAISLAQYAMTFVSIRYAIQSLRNAVNTVKELDSAFVELSRISHDSSATLEEFRKKSFEVADAVGSTASQVINAAAQWEHLGYNVKEASELAEVSMIYKNIADGMSSDAEATEDLVSIMKAYDFQADQAIDVTDALIAVSNNYAVTAADIGNALKRSASAMAVANNTFEQNVALATAMAEVTQNAEKSGSALQVLSLRIRGAKTELQDMGEDTEGMASSTSKLRNQIKGLTKGFDIMKDETTFKQTYDIMKGIAAVWDDLDDISRASLLETLAGKVRANQVAALLDNFSQAEKVLQTIAEDEGTAIANNEAKLNTIEARITKFRNATQHLTADIFQPELIKDVIDGGTTLVNILDKFIQKAGSLSLIGGIFGGLSTLRGGGLLGELENSVDNFKAYLWERREQKDFNQLGLTPSFSKGEITQFTALHALGGTDYAIKKMGNLTKAQKAVLKYLAEEPQANLDDAIMALGFSADESSKKLSELGNKANSIFTKIKQTAANFALGVGITVGIQALIQVIDEAINHQSRLEASTKNYGQILSSTSSEINGFAESITKQKDIINNHNSSIEEITNARIKLHDIQEEMIATYGSEADIIAAVTAAINDQTDATIELGKIKEKQYHNTRGQFENDNDGVLKGIGRWFAGFLDFGRGNSGKRNHDTAMDEVINTVEAYQLDFTRYFNNYTASSVSDKWKQIRNKNNWDNPANVVDNVETVISAFDELLEATEEAYAKREITDIQYKTYVRNFEQARAKAQTSYDSVKDYYNANVVYEKIQKKANLNESYNNLTRLNTRYSSAKTSEEQAEIYKEYLDVLNTAIAQANGDKQVVDQFNNLYPVLQAEAKKWKFELDFSTPTSGLKQQAQKYVDELKGQLGREITEDDLLNWNPIDHDLENTTYSNLMGLAEKYGVDGGQLVRALELPTKEYVEFVRIAGEDVVSSLSDTERKALSDYKGAAAKFQSYYRDGFRKFKDEAKAQSYAVAKLLREATEVKKQPTNESKITGYAGVSSSLDSISKIYEDVKNGNGFDWSFLQDDFKKQYADLDDYQDAYSEFIDTIRKSPSDIEACQNAFNKLASAIVYSSGVLDNLSIEDKDAAIQTLTSHGFSLASATEFVNDAIAKSEAHAKALAEAEEYLENSGIDLQNVTLDEANKFIVLGNATDAVKQELARLYLQKQITNGLSIKTQGDIDNLKALAEAAHLTRQELAKLKSDAISSANAQIAAENSNVINSGGVGALRLMEKSQRDIESALSGISTDVEEFQWGNFNGSSTNGSNGGKSGSGGGSDKEPSKTDKELDYVNRYLQILQEQNDELRENVDNQYVILQDAKDNVVTFQDALSDLGSAQRELDALGVGYKSEEFQEFIDNLDLSAPADEIMDNVREITGAYDEVATVVDDTKEMVQPREAEQQYDPQIFDDIWKLVPGGSSDYVEHDKSPIIEAVDDEIDGYDDVTKAVVKYKTALDDLANAKDATSKTLSENGTGQLTYIKQLQESDQKLIDAYKEAASSYGTEWADYQKKILESWGEEKGQQYIKDILYGNLNPEEWERMITYDQNNQAEKDKVELLERAQTAYDHHEESLKTMREWQQKLNEDIQKEYEIRLNIVKAEMVAIENKMNEAQFDLDMKEILGEVVQEADYQRLIDISGEQVENYRQQLDVLNEQLDSLDEGEQAWYDCKQQIADCENSIRDCVKQQAEWNEAILRMPVENISRFLGLIQNLGQTLKNWLTVNDAKGIAQTAEQIQTSWKTAYDQIADSDLGLMKQLEDYEDLLENYDLGQSKFSEVDDEIQGARDSVESLVEEMIELNKQLLTLPIDKISEMTEYLDGTLSDLQQVQSDYETTINTVIDLINHQTEKIQEEYEDLQKKIEDQIKPLQDQIDALEKANEKRDRQLQIENALYELEKAREQHTVQVIRNGQVRYESDAEAVRNAQQGYDDAQYNKLIGDLQDQIEALNKQLSDAEEATNDQVDALNDLIKNRWETIMPDTERNRNEEIASQFFKDMFGVTNWKDLVLAGKDANGKFADERIYQGTRAGYEQNSIEMRDTQRQIDINNLITEQLTRLVEDFQADKINSEQLSTKVSTLMNFVSDGLITGQERLENTLSLGDYSNLGSALKDANRQRGDQMAIFNDNLKIAQENRKQVNEIIGRWDEFKIWYDETYRQLYEQYKKIDFIGDTVAKWYDDYDDDGDGPSGVWDGESSRWDDDHYHAGDGYHDAGLNGYHYSSGLEKGSVGNMSASDKFKAIQALGLRKLDPDEFPAILHLGEGVINPKQQSTMLGNVRQALALGASGGGAVIQMSFGDITLPSVTNGQDFAESLATQFQPAMNQIFSKIFRR